MVSDAQGVKAEIAMRVNEKMSEVSNHCHCLARFQCCGRQYSVAILSRVDCMQRTKVPWKPTKVPSPRNHSMCDTLDRKDPASRESFEDLTDLVARTTTGPSADRTTCEPLPQPLPYAHNTIASYCPHTALCRVKAMV